MSGRENSAQILSICPVNLGGICYPKTGQFRRDLTDQNRSNYVGLDTLPQKTGLERGMNSLKLEDIEYITANRGYQKVIKEMNAQVEKDLGKADIASKVQNVILPKVKKLIVSRLDKLSMSDKQRKLMIEKLESISFEGTNCRELGDGESENSGYSAVASLLVPNAFYDPMSNVFKICSGYLIQSTSEFDLVGTIAHELSHSIDPCTIARGPAGGGFQYSNQTDLKKMEQEYPLKNVIQCLRNRQSIEAKNFRMDITRQVDKDTFLAERDDVKKKSYSAPTFCEEDQIGESFCDWMAAEVLPVYMAENHKLTTDQYRNGYANVFRKRLNGTVLF